VIKTKKQVFYALVVAGKQLVTSAFVLYSGSEVVFPVAFILPRLGIQNLVNSGTPHVHTGKVRLIFRCIAKCRRFLPALFIKINISIAL
jgi:hypothetical protein